MTGWLIPLIAVVGVVFLAVVWSWIVAEMLKRL